MRVRFGLLGLALAAGLGASVAAASVSAGGPAAARLQAFDGCPSFLAYARKQALPLVGPWGLGGVVGIAAGLWAILSLPAMEGRVQDGWLLLSVAGTVIGWVTGVVLVASRQRVPVYDTEYQPPPSHD